jgi:hypothetical protein
MITATDGLGKIAVTPWFDANNKKQDFIEFRIVCS